MSSMSGSSMAEAYFTTRILHKKMNSTTTSNVHRATKKSVPNNDDHASNVGCFLTSFKKIHPTSSSTVPASVSSIGSSQ
nr:hypothetical protein [Tanacetum cinerariifolium]